MYGAAILVPLLGPDQTSNFTCAESNANEQNLLFLLTSIRFGTFEPGLRGAKMAARTSKS